MLSELGEALLDRWQYEPQKGLSQEATLSTVEKDVLITELVIALTSHRRLILTQSYPERHPQ